jgi:hypothetical protein
VSDAACVYETVRDSVTLDQTRPHRELLVCRCGTEAYDHATGPVSALEAVHLEMPLGCVPEARLRGSRSVRQLGNESGAACRPLVMCLVVGLAVLALPPAQAASAFLWILVQRSSRSARVQSVDTSFVV